LSVAEEGVGKRAEATRGGRRAERTVSGRRERLSARASEGDVVVTVRAGG
jgi:hypothetical protein